MPNFFYSHAISHVADIIITVLFHLPNYMYNCNMSKVLICEIIHGNYIFIDTY